MKFINNSKDSIEVRVGERFNYSWVNINPGETIDLPEDKGKRYGFEEVLIKAQLSLNQVKTTEGQIGDKKVETKQIERPYDFLQELINIKGIGRKTALDIRKVFPTKKDLINAISNDDELPFRDDIEEKLRKEYGK